MTDDLRPIRRPLRRARARRNDERSRHGHIGARHGPPGDAGGGLARRPARHDLWPERPHHAGPGVQRRDAERYSGRHLLGAAEEPRALLQPLRRRGDAVHAAHHLDRHRPARRRSPRLSGFARLRAPAPGFRPRAVRQDQARHARHRLAQQHDAGSDLASAAVQADAVPRQRRGPEQRSPSPSRRRRPTRPAPTIRRSWRRARLRCRR